jgi:hypothetical protein
MSHVTVTVDNGAKNHTTVHPLEMALIKGEVTVETVSHPSKGFA